MKCLETRRTPEGFRRRRYQRDDGVRLTTIEVPIEIWNAVKRTDVVVARGASRDRQLERQARKLRALALLRDGWKPEAVANELNFTTSAIQRWNRGLK